MIKRRLCPDINFFARNFCFVVAGICLQGIIGKIYEKPLQIIEGNYFNKCNLSATSYIIVTSNIFKYNKSILYRKVLH